MSRSNGSGHSGTIVTIIVALVGLVGVLLAAGPENVRDQTKAAFGQYPVPIIMRAERQKPTAESPVTVTVTNPSHEEVVITGYHVTPVSSQANATSVAVNTAEPEVPLAVADDLPKECRRRRKGRVHP